MSRKESFFSSNISNYDRKFMFDYKSLFYFSIISNHTNTPFVWTWNLSLIYLNINASPHLVNKSFSFRALIMLHLFIIVGKENENELISFFSHHRSIDRFIFFFFFFFHIKLRTTKKANKQKRALTSFFEYIPSISNLCVNWLFPKFFFFLFNICCLLWIIRNY